MDPGEAPREVWKLVTRAEWREAEAAGVFAGSAVDLEDGFIHFSTAAQAQETADRHFAGVPELLLVCVDAAALGEALRYEPSRGGDLFPHLYGPLSLDAVREVHPVLRDADGRAALGALLER